MGFGDSISAGLDVTAGAAGAAIGSAIGGKLTNAIGGLSIGGVDIGSMLNSLTREDPAITYNYCLEIDGLRSVHFKEVSGMKMTTKTTPIREGGNNLFEHHLIEGATFENLKIKRGFYSAHDDFYLWMRSVHEASKYAPPKTFSLVVLTDDWQESCRFNFVGAIPVSWSGPSFDAEAKGQIAFEEIEIHYDYFDIEKMDIVSSIVQGGLSAAVNAAASFI